MTIRRVFVSLFVLALLLPGCSGDSKDQKKTESRGSAQIRVASMAFPLVDVNLDDQMILDDMIYPFISDYQTVSAGKHDLRVTPTSGNGASLDLTLEDGHSYLIVSYGSAADHTLKLIDETDTLSKIGPDQNWILILHLLPGGPALDGYIAGNLTVENLAYGEERLYAAPTGPFEWKMTMAGMSDLALYQQANTGLPSVYTVVTITGSLLNPVISLDTQTPLNLLDFFTEVAQQGDYYDTALEMLNKSGVAEELSGPGPFTLFAPWDSSFVNVSTETDPARLKQVTLYHVIAEDVSPYALYHRTKLATLEGSPLTVTAANAQPYFTLNGSVGVHQAYHTSNGTLYEVDGVLTPPPAK